MENRHTPDAQGDIRQKEPSLSNLGEDLRLARQAKKLTIRQAAEETRISYRHLENIEAGRYQDLPGGMYNRAFLRSYCAYLGLHPDEFLLRYEKESTPLSERIAKAKARAQHLPTASLNIPPVLIWTAMLLLSIIGLYFSRGWISEVFSPYFSAPPANRIPVQSTASPAAETKPAAPVIDTAGPPANLAQDQPVEGTGLAVATEQAPGTIRLELHGSHDCWMSVDADGRTIYSATMRPGETQIFDARDKFELILGNAGGVSMRINGKPAKAIGKSGEVVRLVIDPQSIPDLLEKRTP